MLKLFKTREKGNTDIRGGWTFVIAADEDEAKRMTGRPEAEEISLEKPMSICESRERWDTDRHLRADPGAELFVMGRDCPDFRSGEFEGKIVEVQQHFCDTLCTDLSMCCVGKVYNG